MKRRLRVTMELTVADLCDADRMQLALDMQNNAEDGEDAVAPDADDLPSLADATEQDVGQILTEGINPYTTGEFFAGTEVYVGLEKAELIEAKWVSEPEEGDLPPMYQYRTAF